MSSVLSLLVLASIASPSPAPAETASDAPMPARSPFLNIATPSVPLDAELQTLLLDGPDPGNGCRPTCIE